MFEAEPSEFAMQFDSVEVEVTEVRGPFPIMFTVYLVKDGKRIMDLTSRTLFGSGDTLRITGIEGQFKVTIT